MARKVAHHKPGIRKVAVIGAGVMGAGIAAHVANAGLPVVLLDIVPKDAPKKAKGNEARRNAIALGAIEKLKKTNPAALMHPANAKLITPGNTEDDLALLADCDWIIEAVIERLDIKQALYAKIAKVRHKNAVVSSNTSTIPLETLVKGLPQSFRDYFLITHFFNPPRYLRLLEVVSGPDTLPEVTDLVSDFCDVNLGKSVVPCNDTPGFIANRIGTYWMHAAITKAIAQGITVEEADALLSRPIGVPKTGVFGLVDLVGVDLIPHVLGSLLGALPKKDAFHALGPLPPLMEKMIADGMTGRKGKGGFYKLDEQKRKQAIDLKTGNYHPVKKPRLGALAASKKGGLKALVTHHSPQGRYAWTVVRDMLIYAADLIGNAKDSIAPDIESVDRAMRLGFAMKYGPFELMDKLGTDWFATELKTEGLPLPKILQAARGRKLYAEQNGKLCFLDLSGVYKPVPRPLGVLLLEDVKRRSKPLARNMSASLWNIGDGVACLEFHSKMNSLDPFNLAMVGKAVKLVPAHGLKALVLYNEGANYSVGANIGMLKYLAIFRLFPLIRLVLWHGQNTYLKLKNAPFPVVGAPANMALGGGCESLLHCHAIVAHAETYMGLVEGGVGIIPGWGGCKELLGRAIEAPDRKGGPMPPVVKTFETIAMAKVSKSAAEARDLLFLRPTDDVVMNRDRLLAAAKARALAMVPGFKAPAPHTYRLPGLSGLTALKLALHDFAKKGVATPHDLVVGEGLGKVLTGNGTDPADTLTEQDILRLERDVFVPLTKTKATQARVNHMLSKGKPLRN